jgi:DNA-binding transcriptional MerR regulator/effector-binding domain-containing protein
MATTLLTIGEFSRMTHLSVKALRHYHDVGVLAPATIDPGTGYRCYGADQVTAAQVVRRLRDLGMPLDGIRAVLLAPDPAARNREIAAHLERMERQLEQTQVAVRGLRALIGGTAPAPLVEFRTIPAVTALAITEAVGWDDAVTWGSAAFDELIAAAEESGLTRSGPLGALFPGDFFELERGQLTAFVPVTGPSGAGAGQRGTAGRVRRCEIAGIEAAVAVHDGPPDETDRTYGALGTVVAQRAIGVDGPVREYYPDGFVPGPHRTEICWPVFRTAGA